MLKKKVKEIIVVIKKGCMFAPRKTRMRVLVLLGHGHKKGWFKFFKKNKSKKFCENKKGFYICTRLTRKRVKDKIKKFINILN